jgi:hypothetical protein
MQFRTPVWVVCIFMLFVAKSPQNAVPFLVPRPFPLLGIAIAAYYVLVTRFTTKMFGIVSQKVQ